jgi:hypothetical protein
MESAGDNIKSWASMLEALHLCSATTILDN